MKKIALLLMAVAVFATTTCQKEFESGGVTAVIIDEEVLYLIHGNKAKLTASVEPASASQDVVWTSSDGSIATVSQSGDVTAISAGVAYIAATSKQGKRVGTCAVFVDPIPVTGVTLIPTLDMLVHEVFTLEPVIKPDDAADKFVRWESSDEKVATVSILGEVKALFPGTAEIKVATRDGDFTASCTVTVTKIPVTSVTLDQTEVIVNENERVTLKVTVTPEDASFQEVTWSSSNTDVATVNQNGDVTARNAGVVIITAIADGVEAKCKITVFPAVVQGLVEEVVWVDELVLSWTAQGIPLADFGDNLKAGTILRFYFSSLGANPKIKLYYGDWAGPIIIDDPNFIPGGSDDLLAIPAGSAYYDIVLTAEMVHNMLNPSWGSDALLIMGDGCTIYKISVLNEAPTAMVETVVYDEAHTQSWDGKYVPLANFVDAGIKVGSILKFYFDASGAQCQVFAGDWDPMFIEFRVDVGSTEYELVVTEEMLDRILNPSWGNAGLVFQGEFTFVKLTVVNAVVVSETVVYDEAHTQSWDGKYVPLENLVNAGIKVGSILTFYFDASGAQCQVFAGDWDPMFIEFRVDAGSTEYELVVTEEMLDRILNPSWGNAGLVFQGEFTFVKLTLKN